MSADSKPHSEQLKVTENVYELLVQEKRRRRGLEEQYQAALDLLARVQPELAPNLAEADDLRRKFGLGGGEPILYEIAEFLSNPATEGGGAPGEYDRPDSPSVLDSTIDTEGAEAGWSGAPDPASMRHDSASTTEGGE